MLMVTLLVLSMLVTIIRGVNKRFNTNYYVPMERACADFWEVKRSDGGKEWCMTDDPKLRPKDDVCFKRLGVKTKMQGDGDTARVYAIQPVIDRDLKMDISTNCHMPWDGVNSNTGPPNKVKGNSCTV